MDNEPILAVLHVSSAEAGEQDVSILTSPFNIGRIKPNDLVLANAKVSRSHARILIEADRIHLIDLNSSNGTFVGHEKLTPNEPFSLAFGTSFEIGSFTLRLDPAPQAKPAETETPMEGPLTETVAPGGPEAELSPAEPAPVEVSQPEAEAAGPAAEKALSVESAHVSVGAAEMPPPLIPISPSSSIGGGDGFGPYNEAIGLPNDYSRYLQYLPPIYSEKDFIGKFLLAFEGVLSPIEQMVDNFDQYLDPLTAPDYFLEQLAAWLDLTLDEKWPMQKRRKIVKEAAELYRRRGTRWCLSRHLEIYSGIVPEIREPDNQPHHFEVVIRAPKGTRLDSATLDRIILANKPAHTTYKLEVVYI